MTGPHWEGPCHAGVDAGDCGLSYVELVVSLAVIAVMTCLAVPATAYSIDTGRARHATGFLAARVRLARQRAVTTSHAVALVFDQAGTRWVFRVCDDGNGNGLRRTDMQAGRDTCVEGPYDIAAMFPGVQIAVDPTLPGPDGDAGSTDPVKFGRGDIASFSPEGTGTAGTVFLRSSAGRQYAIRVSNVTGRTRALRYDTGTRKWITE